MMTIQTTTKRVLSTRGYREMDKILRGNSIGVDAHTMVGMGNLNFLENAISDILAREVPGDFIECGVWRGGNSIFATAMFLLWDKTAGRQVFVADAFEKGFPKSTKEDKLKWEKLNTPLFMDSEEKVKQNFATYNMLRANVIFLSGFFADTLPTAPLSKLAIVRLDGDSYASYIFNLNILYPKLAVGGYLIVDDWGIAPCILDKDVIPFVRICLVVESTEFLKCRPATLIYAALEPINVASVLSFMAVPINSVYFSSALKNSQKAEEDGE
ncbi:unnamed protein product [Bathycoccus prasinos]